LLRLYTISFLVIITLNTTVYSQVGITTVGVQIKPIIPINYFGAGPIQVSNEYASLDLSSKLGYSFGMVVRHGFTKMISLNLESIIPEEIIIFLEPLIMNILYR